MVTGDPLIIRAERQRRRKHYSATLGKWQGKRAEFKANGRVPFWVKVYMVREFKRMSRLHRGWRPRDL